VNTIARALPVRIRGRIGDRVGDGILIALTLLASLVAVVVLIAIAVKLVDDASQSIARYGIGFIGHTAWTPGEGVRNVFGAGAFLFGTAVTSATALLFATPIGVAIGLYLSELAPRGVRGIVGALVELLAAIPSVVLGLWGILVLGPFLQQHLESWLHSAFGFIPLFGTPAAAGVGLFNAALILTIMVVPIIASISRELFQRVPTELEEGALALGATHWEMVRGVILDAARPGIAAAAVLGLGRALGEAIAVAQVVGGGSLAGPALIHASLFGPGDTLASRVANQFAGATTNLQISSLFYLAVILLVIGLLTNVAAQMIVRRFEFAPARGI
jgi:phosphate transport system permease protein